MAPQKKFGAVIFDTFGTLVDRHSAVAREVSRLLANNHALDVDAFATNWNARIQLSMKPVRDGERAWVNIDTLEAETLEDVLAEFGVVADASTKKKLVQAGFFAFFPEIASRIRWRSPMLANFAGFFLTLGSAGSSLWPVTPNFLHKKFL